MSLSVFNSGDKLTKQNHHTNDVEDFRYDLTIDIAYLFEDGVKAVPVTNVH